MARPVTREGLHSCIADSIFSIRLARRLVETIMDAVQGARSSPKPRSTPHGAWLKPPGTRRRPARLGAISRNGGGDRWVSANASEIPLAVAGDVSVAIALKGATRGQCFLTSGPTSRADPGHLKQIRRLKRIIPEISVISRRSPSQTLSSPWTPRSRIDGRGRRYWRCKW